MEFIVRLSFFALTLFGFFLCTPLWADEADTFNATIAETIVRDDNLFRVPTGVTPMLALTGNPARGDTVHAGSVNLKLDKTFSLQHVHVGVNLASYHFSNFSFLNYQAKGFDARWDWSLTPHLTGKIGAERTQSLNNFVDYQGYSRNIRTIENRNASLEYDVLGTWHILGGAGHNKVVDTYVLPTSNKSTNFAEAGIKYLSGSGSSVALLNRTSRISWLDVPRNEFLQFDVAATQHDSEVQINLPLTGKSQVQAVATRLKRTHQNFSSRDFSGTAGTFNYTWTPTGKALILFSASRSYIDWWDVATSYNITNTVTLAPTWQFSPELSAKLRLERSRRNFFAPIFIFDGVPLRQDVIQTGQLSLEWLPVRNIAMAVSLQKERRNSNQEDVTYADTMTSLDMRLSF